MNQHILFSSEVPLQRYLNDSLKRYEKIHPKKYEDKDRPDLYRASLNRSGPISLCTSYMNSSDYIPFNSMSNEFNYKYLKLCQEYSLNPSVETATALIRGHTQKKSHKRKAAVPPTTSTGGQSSLFIPENMMTALMYSDVLHDIGHEYIRWAFAHIDNTIMPRTNIQRRNITMTVYNEWLRIANINESEFIKGYQNVIAIWENILHTDSEELTICIDGFLNNVQIDANRNLYEDTCLETGLFLLLLHKSGRSFRKLTIVDGLFNEIDGFYMVDYIHNYISALSRIMRGVVVVTTYIHPIQPRYIPFSVTNTVITLRNNMDILIKNRQNAWYAHDVNDVFHLPYNKYNLIELFRMNKNSEDSNIQQLLKNAAEVNFFRDAYRVDVAVQNNWSFITHDRLAFAFYNILVSRLNVPNRGIFAAKSPTQNSPDSLEIQCLTHI